MIRIVYEWSSGWPVMLCLAGVGVAVVLGLCRGRWARLLPGVLLALSMVGVTLTAPLIPRLAFVGMCAALLAWYYAVMRRAVTRVRLAASVGVLACVFVVAALEWRWFAWHGAGIEPHTRVVVIGDSVSAGIGGVYERVWPIQLHQRLGVDVLNVAVAGARVSDALCRQVPHIDAGPAMVVLEIGGNDMLSRVPLGKFEDELDALIRGVVGVDRAVIMFELPTPPFHAGYAAVQRKVAARHGVRLIPRRYFIHLIADTASTTDGAHLSQSGHDRMADLIVSLLGPSLRAASSPGYRSPNTRTLLVP